ncbi:hypothetical protein Pmani_025533 [Petrolisthes manimaculis]|uniref:Essential MCU regulator, mitochondrial n=1 Tax=Petrolisthes manimaculis TaxID=1843537 RepID=A0AAE1P7R2_9EUCA|nr:hypothetical protein Pmani_025533 [Petrolisthes manimaculis]
MSTAPLQLLLRPLHRTAKLTRGVSQRRIHLSRTHNDTFTPTDAVMPRPHVCTYLGYIGVAITITQGIFIGAEMSKNIASFLEENELFVPSDDDDDD